MTVTLRQLRAWLAAAVLACGAVVGVSVWATLGHDTPAPVGPFPTITITNPVTHSVTSTVTRTAHPRSSFGQPPVIVQPVPSVRPVTRTRVMTVPPRRTVTRTRPAPTPTRRRTIPPHPLPTLPLICGALNVPAVCGGTS